MIDEDKFNVKFKEFYEFQESKDSEIELIVTSLLTKVENVIKVPVKVIADPTAYVIIGKEIDLSVKDYFVQGYGDISYSGKSSSGVNVRTNPIVKLNASNEHITDLGVYKADQTPLRQDELLTTLTKDQKDYRFYLKAKITDFIEKRDYTGIMTVYFELN